MPSPLAGLVAGLVATAPMTLAMELMYRRLPRREQYALQPRRISDNLLGAVGLDEGMDEATRRRVAVLNHFAYGGTVGAAYGAVTRRAPRHPVASGVAFGLGVWGASYLGWLPATGLHEPATRDSPRRNALTIGAHVVWGAAMGYMAHRLDRGLERERRGASARRCPRPTSRASSLGRTG